MASDNNSPFKSPFSKNEKPNIQSPYSQYEKPNLGNAFTGDRPETMDKPTLGITPLGTTIRYVGNNEDLAKSEANQQAIAEHRARNKGLSGDTSVTLDMKTGNIKISAPKAIINSEAGQR